MGSELIVAMSFTGFFMAWSFGNTLFYGETRRAVDAAVQIPLDSDQLAMLHTPSENSEDACSPAKDSVALQLISVVFVLNSAAATLMQGMLTAILFSWLQLDIAIVFQMLAVVQGISV